MTGRSGAWAGAILALFSATAQAAEVRYEMESAAEFEADGWFHNGDVPPTFAASEMTVVSTAFNEWILYNDPNSPTRWWNYVTAQKGWWIEARLHVIAAPDSASCFDGGPGIWIHDGTTLLKFTFTQTQARISYPMLSPIAMDPTDGFHIYRVQNLGGSHIQVLVDGQQQLDLTEVGSGGGTEGITIGDLGGCGGSTVVWDYLAYDTAAPGTETDDSDGDGLEAAVDLCPADADPEQLDTDADRLGDVCDSCPNDPQNDFDQDGLCADVDVCPGSPDNLDSNGNGICDSEECLNQGGVPTAPAARIAPPCPVPGCDCFVGIDPVNPLPPGTGGGSSSGGSGNAGGTGGSGSGTSGSGTGGATASTDPMTPGDPAQNDPNDPAGGDPVGSSGDTDVASQSVASTENDATCMLAPGRGAFGRLWLSLVLGIAAFASHRRRTGQRAQ